MAEDYRALNTYPAFKTFTASATGCTEILLPSACNQVSIGSDGTKLVMGQQGFTEGDNLMTSQTDTAFIPSSNFLIIKLGKGMNRANSLFVQSSSGSVLVRVILEEA